jgi:hypothetical protein
MNRVVSEEQDRGEEQSPKMKHLSPISKIHPPGIYTRHGSIQKSIEPALKRPVSPYAGPVGLFYSPGRFYTAVNTVAL